MKLFTLDVIYHNMIKEIEKPIDTISKIRERQKKIRDIVRLYHKKLDNISVSLKEDPVLIDELVEAANVDRDVAERFLTILFEEIKRNILNGNVVKIIGFGTFYINGPHRNNKGRIVIPLEISSILNVFFKASRALKKEMREQEESNI